MRSCRKSQSPLQNERGAALLLALAVIALLTITVSEFFFSAEVDSRMARNSVHSLQAALLARSGLAIGEALLAKDADPVTDSFLEEWCPAQAREGMACQIEDGAGLVQIPEGMRLRVEIWDESAKINVNLTRPQNQNEWRLGNMTADPRSAPQRYQSWLFALGRVLQARGISEDVVLALDEYWSRMYEVYFGPLSNSTAPGGAAATPTVPAPSLGGTPALTPPPLTTLYFQSLDELAAVTGFLRSSDLPRVRPVVTALGWPFQSQVNANTASREVLQAIIGDSEVVETMISERQNQPLPASTVVTMLNSSQVLQDPQYRNARVMVGARSNVFWIRASAIVNIDPMTGRGGVARSAEMVVRRDPRPVQPGAAGSMNRWKLTRLYWQKLGGAVLFRSDSAESAMTSGARGAEFEY
jgi:type II secretory pathway component PulK